MVLWSLAFALRVTPLRAAAPPDLVVVISLDQFRHDYLERFRPFFSPGGFNLLLEHGANFADCHFQHSITKTAPGHAVMLTGVHANLNGIIANDWIDRGSFERVSCVGDPAEQIVGLPPPTAARLPGYLDPYLGRSPRNLLVTTVGDTLKLDRGGRPKVIGISNKDRAAILMSGKLADAAYFMEAGHMVTSTYYMKQLPAWVKAWNDADKARAYFGQTWDRVLPAADYAIQGADDAPGEFDGAGLGRSFPKKITGGDDTPTPNFYETIFRTPFSSELLADFACAVVENEQLGRRGVTDLLCVSFSATDYIGHDYGPDSHEVMDNVIRTDRILEKFFQFLDAKVGLQHCTIILTADHGTAPLPEHVTELSQGRIPAGRIDLKQMLVTLEAALDRKFGPRAGHGGWLVTDDAWLLVLPDALKEKNLTSAAVQTVVRDTLLTLDFVEVAYTREQLEAGEVRGELGQRALLSFNRERSGDVFYQAKPYFVNKEKYGTNHGTPYDYDTHVPLLWYGVGVKPGLYSARVGMDDLAPTLAHLLALPAPPLSNGHVLF